MKVSVIRGVAVAIMLASFDSADEYDSGASEQRKDVFCAYQTDNEDGECQGQEHNI